METKEYFNSRFTEFRKVKIKDVEQRKREDLDKAYRIFRLFFQMEDQGHASETGSY